MTRKVYLVCLAFLVYLVPCRAVFIPPYLTGPLPVGVTTYELNNTAIEPARDLIVSIFYPAKEDTCRNYPLSPAFGPQTNVFTDGWIAFTPGSSATVQMHAYVSAPISPLSAHSPVIFLSPGYGNSRVYYSGTAQNLASNGYIVVTMDHPLDSSFMEYPDGRNATYQEIDLDPEHPVPMEEYAPFVERRVSDILSILADLEKSKPRIPGLRGKLKLENVGALGHSLGGCTAAALMLNSTGFVAGVNMDGSMTGPVMTAGLDSPFFLLANEVHVKDFGYPGETYFDPTWNTFWYALRGWKRDIRINGTDHHHYSDTLYLENLFTPDDERNLGRLAGERMYVVLSAYLVDFFDKWFKVGDGRLLDGPVEGFPEAIYD